MSWRHVQVIVSKQHGHAEAERKLGTAPMVLRTGALDIDPEHRRVTRDGTPLDLPALSFRLLVALVTRAPHTVSKDELIQAVWGRSAVSDETLAQRVRLLRQALGGQAGDGATGLFTAVRGEGYRWQLPVARVPRLVATAAAPTSDGRREEKQDRFPRWPWVMVVAVALGLVILVGGPRMFRATPGPASPIDSVTTVAVLPFEAPPEQSHLALGLEEALRSRLTSVPGLAVRSRTWSPQAVAGPGPSMSPGGADAVVSGRVAGGGGSGLQLALEVLDVASDTLLWARRYEIDLTVGNVFELQARIADEITQSLADEVSTAGTSSASSLPTTSLAAYDAYLLGRYQTFLQTPDSLRQAVEYLSAAVRIDPQFAEAWASLGWAYTFQGTSYGGQAPGSVYPLAREAALRALSLQPQLADARSLHADILTWYDWDYRAAEAEYLSAVEGDRYNVLGYALLLSVLERHEEAISLVERRLSLHPDDPYVNVNTAWRYLNAGRLELAIATARRAQVHPDGPAVLGRALLADGQWDEALAVFEADAARRGRAPAQLANLAIAYLVTGARAQGAEVSRELAQLAAQRYVSPVLRARVAFRAGDADGGFALLEAGLAERSRGMIFLPVLRDLDGYRQDPRYLTVIERMGTAPGSRP